MWDNQASFWVCCSTCSQPRQQTHRLFHWSPFLWGCIAWWVRSCSHWLHVPKNGRFYKNRKKFPVSLLFPDVLRILFIVCRYCMYQVYVHTASSVSRIYVGQGHLYVPFLMSQFLRNSRLMVLVLTPMAFAISFLLFPSFNIKEIPYLCYRVKCFIFTTDFGRRFDGVK